ncbi:MAG: hypothetical protein O7H39_02865 [Gammaproteobacteria bacterium]|nr:hypothetical protein [Gammaproteobacteria bacterium]
MSTAEFREQARGWIEANLPTSLKHSAQLEGYSGGNKETVANPDVGKWFDLCYERGWTVPN